MFQVVTGSNWHEIMYAGVEARRDLKPSYFFTTFFAVCVLVSMNLMIGVMIDLYDNIKKQREKESKVGESQDNSSADVVVKRKQQMKGMFDFVHDRELQAIRTEHFNSFKVQTLKVQ